MTMRGYEVKLFALISAAQLEQRGPMIEARVFIPAPSEDKYVVLSLWHGKTKISMTIKPVDMLMEETKDVT